MVHLEKIEGGGWRVSRVMPCGPSMQAAASALEAINPQAYAVVQCDGHGNTAAPPTDADRAAAKALREWAESQDGDDMGLKAGEAR